MTGPDSMSLYKFVVRALCNGIAVYYDIEFKVIVTILLPVSLWQDISIHV